MEELYVIEEIPASVVIPEEVVTVNREDSKEHSILKKRGRFRYQKKHTTDVCEDDELFKGVLVETEYGRGLILSKTKYTLKVRFSDNKVSNIFPESVIRVIEEK